MNSKNTAYSTLKIFAHNEKIVSLQKNELTAPLYVRIKPTNLCNHNCNYCHYGKGQYLDLDQFEYKDQIEWKILKETLENFSEIGVKAITFSGGGVPLFYPYIIDAMKLAHENAIEFSIITNGQKLNGDIAKELVNAKWVRISLDSGTRETYSKIRSIPLEWHDEVMDNIKNFAKIKNPECELGVNFVVNKDNAAEVYLTGKKLQEIGVNHVKFAAKMGHDANEYHKDIKQNVIDQIHKLKEDFEGSGFSIINLYEHDFDTSAVFKRNYSRCLIKEIVPVIGADAKVYFCQDKVYLKSGIVGDLKQSKFKDMWFSDETIKKMSKFDAKKECNHHCVHDGRNIILNAFLDLNKNHINFI